MTDMVTDLHRGGFLQAVWQQAGAPAPNIQ